MGKGQAFAEMALRRQNLPFTDANQYDKLTKTNSYFVVSYEEYVIITDQASKE